MVSTPPSGRHSQITDTQRALGRALRAKATQEGLTCSQVGERAGLHGTTVLRLFRDGSGSWDTVERVARVLRTTISQGLRDQVEDGLADEDTLSIAEALEADAARPGRSGNG